MRESLSNKRVCVISGLDPWGAAGIFQDIAVIRAFKLECHGIATTLTVQNNSSWQSQTPVDPDLILAQWQAISAVSPPEVIKIGMLPSSGVCQAVLEIIKDFRGWVILDPVYGASTQAPSMASELKAALQQLLPYIDIITPNTLELGLLTDKPTSDQSQLYTAGQYLQSLGPKQVFIKAGHMPSKGKVEDIYLSPHTTVVFTANQHNSDFRGTGCSLSAAIAAQLALGEDVDSALTRAHSHLQTWMQASPPQQRWLQPSLDSSAVPQLTCLRRWQDHGGYRFASCGAEPLGIYPIVPRAHWVAMFLAAGVTTIQLRIKDLEGKALYEEIQQAVALCRDSNARLFINDHWEAAIECQAYGVHLGQEDIATADLSAIARAGLRLGLSTHSHYEASIAAQLQPSYVALGPIFETTCKSMRFGPRGFDRLRAWRQYFPELPVVAIGGMKQKDIVPARQAGADGVAVISALLEHADPQAEAEQWCRTWSTD